LNSSKYLPAFRRKLLAPPAGQK